MKRYALGFYGSIPALTQAIVRTGAVPAEFEAAWLHVPSVIGYNFILHGVTVNDKAVDAWTGPVLASCDPFTPPVGYAECKSYLTTRSSSDILGNVTVTFTTTVEL